MNKIKRLSIISLIIGLLTTIALPAGLPVMAIEAQGISIAPARTKEYSGLRSWFIYEAEAKKVINDKAVVSNRGNKTVTLSLAALDGAVTSNGGYTLVADTEANRDIGSWIELSQTEVTLPPRSSQVVDFTVTVPDNADVGSHPGGIVTWEKPPEASSKKKSGGVISVTTRVAARVYLTVPGEIQRKLEVKQISHSVIGGLLYFFLHLKNNGNVQLEPAVDVTIRGPFGKIGDQSGSQIGLLLRGTEITAKLPWQSKAPIFGRYVAKFRLHYGEKDFKGQYVKDEYIDATYVFWIIPWLKLLLWLGLVILLLLLRNMWLWMVIRGRLNTRAKKHKVKKGETLTMIGQLYNVHPKRIARFNLLKWPYELSVGDILLIPQGQMSGLERAALGQEWQAHYQAEQRRAMLTDVRMVASWFGKLRHRRQVAGKTATNRHSGKVRFTEPHPESYDPGQARMTKGGIPMVATETLIAEQGDTIYDIAKFAGIGIEEIVKLNQLRPPYRLRAGQEVVVPIKQKATVVPKRKAKKLATKKKPSNRSTKRKR
ncbi:MAG: LysM peptidoglycan-binding domain-containing protein [Patescibacteria group bacterium]|jgi:LysM repeat protein